MQVKVCGMRNADNVREVEEAGADMVGFICCPESARYVESFPCYLPQRALRVLVTRNASMEFIVERAHALKADMLQLHGEESPEYCRNLRKRIEEEEGREVKVMKSIGVASKESLLRSEEYACSAHLLLFDTACASGGGSGRKFDWSFLSAYGGELPFLLSGGIGMEELEELHHFSHPRWIGVDINSRFELAPALKDVGKIKEFIQRIKTKR